MEYFNLYILCSYIVGFYCFGKSDHDDVTVTCTNRFEYRFELKKQYTNCSQVIELNPVCGMNITIAYQEHPPYLYKQNGTIIGILPGNIFLRCHLFRELSFYYHFLSLMYITSCIFQALVLDKETLIGGTDLE